MTNEYTYNKVYNECRPRILFLTNNPAYYGGNHSMVTILYDLKRKGYDILLLLPGHGEVEEALKEKDIPYEVVDYFAQLFYYKWQWKYLSLPLLALYTLVKFPRILKLARNFAPDVVYSNSSAENVGIFLSHFLGCKHIFHIREFMQEDFSAYFFGGRKAKRAFINHSDGVVFVSKAIAKTVEQGSLDKSKNQVVIYNGIPCHQEYKPRDIGKTINLGIVGIFDPAKGQDTAILYFADLLKQYPNALLHVWGDKDCTYKRKLYKIVDDLELKEKVIFHGYVKDTEIIYEDMHILLMCSRSEGLGRVTIEAMQHSIPVVGYDSGGTKELIRHGENGYIFSTREEFLQAVSSLIDSPDTYHAISKNAYEFASTSFSEKKYCDNIEEFINKVAK